MRKNAFILHIFVFQFIIAPVFSQDISDIGSPLIENFNSHHYNADPQNWNIIQDQRGIIYFANTEGILEYDGHSWRLLPVSNYSIVRALAIDKKGTVYAGAINEFGYLAINKQGEKKYVSLSGRLKNEFHKFGDVHNIIATDNQGIYFFTRQTAFRYFRDSLYHLPKLACESCFYVDNRIILHQFNRFFVYQNGKLLQLPGTENFTSDKGPYQVIPYQKGSLLIAGRYSGCYIYNLNLLEKEMLLLPSTILKDFNTEIDNYLKFNNLQYALKISDNEFLFATVSGGIAIIDKSGKLIRILNKNRGLNNDNVHHVCIDNGGNYWAALDNGISKIERTTSLTVFNELNNLEGVVLSTQQINNKRYVGTADGLFFLPGHQLNVNNDNYLIEKVKGCNTACWNFKETQNGDLLACLTNGLFKIQALQGKQLLDVGKIYGIGSNPAFPEYYFLCRYNGFSAIKYKNNNLIETITFKDIDANIWNMVCDQNNNIWLSTLFSGIIHIRFTGTAITDYEIDHYGLKEGLPRVSYTQLDFFNDTLYVATAKGIFYTPLAESPQKRVKFKPANRFARYLNKDSVKVSQIKITRDKIWVNSKNGIGYFSKENGKSIWHPVPFINKPNYIHGFSVEDSITWIFTDRGLFRYNPYISHKTSYAFNTLIRSVTTSNDSVLFYGTHYQTPDSSGSFAVAANSQVPEFIPVLDYENNALVFTFSCTCFDKPVANEFSYKLKGFDEEWSAWTNENKKEYTNLPAGKYTFMVKSKNVFGNPGKQALYHFVIKPPWYATWPAYIAYILLIGLVIWLIIKLNSRRLTKANIRLENLINKRTEEIRQQNEEITSQSEELVRINAELEKLSIVAKKVDNAVIITDEKGNFEWINEGFTRIFGYDFDELTHLVSANIVGKDTPLEIAKLIKKSIKTKTPASYELPVKTKYGKTLWTQTTLTPILDDEGELRKLVAIDADITDLKNAENEIQHQKEKLEHQNEDIKSSIRYALTIQQAILPLTKDLSQYFDNFVINRPKDIVSGDFIWYYKSEHSETNTDSFFIALIDCTGHGVPGAFMSLIGDSLLNKIIVEKEITDPALILETLDKEVKSALQQDKTDNKDGMVISLCRIDWLSDGNKHLTFSGAKQSIFYFKTQEKSIHTLEASRRSVGGILSRRNKTVFENKQLNLQQGDLLYFFSDGIVDQNSPERKRFGSSRLKQIFEKIHQKNLSQQKTIIENELDNFQQDEEQRDDITVMGIRL